jgi:hypothetical protein
LFEDIIKLEKNNHVVRNTLVDISSSPFLSDSISSLFVSNSKLLFSEFDYYSPIYSFTSLFPQYSTPKNNFNKNLKTHVSVLLLLY